MGQRLKNWRDGKKGKRTITFVAALTLALMLHVSLLFLAQMLIKTEPPKEKPLPVRPISLLDPALSQAPKKAPQIKKQIVSTPKNLEQKRPDKAEFLAEQNNSTEKQTFSKESSLTPEKITTNPRQGSQTASDEGKVSPDPKGLIKVPSWKDLAGSAGSPLSENIANVEQGAETRLNTWEWKHAAFFNRIKSRVAANWFPNTQIKRFDPKGTQIAGQDRMTSVRITIDRNGNLIDVEVISSSGVGYLDDEAVKAFKDAAPFAHPPKQLFEEKNLFSFDFGFHLSIQRGFGFGFQ